jgi:translation elongation factor EF-Tu-like GTPase
VESKRLIFTVEDVFQLQGRGAVITGISGPQASLIRRGARIELDSLTHGPIATTIVEAQIFRGGFSEGSPQRLGILLADPVPSEYLPRGTKVYHVGDIQVA